MDVNTCHICGATIGPTDAFCSDCYYDGLCPDSWDKLIESGSKPLDGVDWLEV